MMPYLEAALWLSVYFFAVQSYEITSELEFSATDWHIFLWHVVAVKSFPVYFNEEVVVGLHFKELVKG